MRHDKVTTRGAAWHLRTYGDDFSEYVHHENFVEHKLDALSHALKTLLVRELDDPEKCIRFWEGIQRALPGCPEEDDFADYTNILAYGFVHLLDRYLRMWQILMVLSKAAVLPLSRSLRVLDIGSGPASALYAVDDFYQAVTAFGCLKSIERFAIVKPELQPIERSSKMEHFFHWLSEYAERRGPFRVLDDDFTSFDPDNWRAKARHDAIDDHSDEESIEPYVPESVIKEWANEQHRYQLVIASNFLTTPKLLRRFEFRIKAAFRQQQPGGVVIVTGAIGENYPTIYAELDGLALRSTHGRVASIPDQFDDEARRPHLICMKRLFIDVWSHVSTTAGADRLSQKGCYREFCIPEVPIKLPSFAVRVYRRA